MPKVVKKYKDNGNRRVRRYRSFQDGGTVQSEGTTYQQMLDYVIGKKGGTSAQYDQLMSDIAYHETGPQQRMNPAAVQLVYENGQYKPQGVGRGMFMFEAGDSAGGITAVNRTVTELKAAGMPVPGWLGELHKGKSADFSKLTKEQQQFLFLGNYLQHPKANLGDVISGKQSSEDFWFNYHQAGGPDVEKERRSSYQESMADRKKRQAKK